MFHSYNDNKKPYYPKFIKQMKFGEDFERQMIAVFKAHGHEAWKSDDWSYDLNVALDVPLFGPHRVRAECKRDANALATGNLALQVSIGGRPTGIHRASAGKPDLWCHKVGDEVWIARLTTIRNLCEMHLSTWGSKVVKASHKVAGSECILMPITVARKAVGTTWIALP